MVDEIQTQRALGASIQRHRRLRGWSQEVLAEKLGLSVAYTGMLERGERMPALPVLLTLADVFESSVDLLLGRGEEDGWMREAMSLVRSVPPASRSTVLAMLRGLVGTAEESVSRVRSKEGA